MRSLALTAEPIAHARDAITSLTIKAREFKDANLPKAASAVESTGKAVSSFARQTSRSAASALRDHDLAALTRSTPVLHAARRFATRNPALLATAGVAVAVLGYAAWRWQRRTAAEDAPKS